jgi:SWI/SNF-related matrix-associated actin-dependent regulator of chromatin subfamily A-like protein 1
VDSFQRDDFMKIAILSMTACGTGITLTSASCIVFAELHWTPSIMLQAEDRAHRIGQCNPVNIYYLHAKETVDDIILQLLSSKSQLVHDILDFSNNEEEKSSEEVSEDN